MLLLEDFSKVQEDANSSVYNLPLSTAISRFIYQSKSLNGSRTRYRFAEKLVEPFNLNSTSVAVLARLASAYVPELNWFLGLATEAFETT